MFREIIVDPCVLEMYYARFVIGLIDLSFLSWIIMSLMLLYGNINDGLKIRCLRMNMYMYRGYIWV
jgi:hypothetical protein